MICRIITFDFSTWNFGNFLVSDLLFGNSKWLRWSKISQIFENLYREFFVQFDFYFWLSRSFGWLIKFKSSFKKKINSIIFQIFRHFKRYFWKFRNVWLNGVKRGPFPALVVVAMVPSLLPHQSTMKFSIEHNTLYD